MTQKKTTPAKTSKPKASTVKAQNKNTPAPRASKPKKEETVDDMAELEALLAADNDLAETESKTEDDDSGALIVGEAVKADVNKDEIYAKQKADKAKGKTSSRKARAKPTGDAPKRTRASRTLTAAMLTSLHDDPQTMLDNIENLPKKVRDKARNALHAAANGGHASVYTQKAIKMMQSATGGVVTSKDLKAQFEQDGYSSGTASAQAQQQMVLLDFLGIAKRNRNELVLNGSSKVLKALQKTDAAKDDMKLAA